MTQKTSKGMATKGAEHGAVASGGQGHWRLLKTRGVNGFVCWCKWPREPGKMGKTDGGWGRGYSRENVPECDPEPKLRGWVIF